MVKNSLIFAFILLLFSNCCRIEKASFSILKGSYLGQTPPDSLAVLFAPNIVSTGMYTRDFTIAPKGDELFFSISSRGYNFIMTSKLENGIWTEPAVAGFSGSEDWFDYEAHITPDGKQLMFLSTRPQKGQEAKTGWFYQDIWAMDKTEKGWSEPYNLSEMVNTLDGEFFPSVTRDGTLYFTRNLPDNKTSVFRSKKVNGKYIEPEVIRFKNDSNLAVYNAFVAADESFIVSCAQGFSDVNNALYCVAFRTENDEWGDLLPFDKRVNFPGIRATSASVSNDGKYLFFGSSKKALDKPEINPGYRISELLELAAVPGNGSSDIYWISSDIIKEMRTK
ncbi:MAG: PD40 domain-containing protein [Salinivirgaceae bacterium]|nr:PD40 domain-containing protein [Salinivirgaceae bacterium]